MVKSRVGWKRLNNPSTFEVDTAGYGNRLDGINPAVMVLKMDRTLQHNN
jgi:hypothetical protein